MYTERAREREKKQRKKNWDGSGLSCCFDEWKKLVISCMKTCERRKKKYKNKMQKCVLYLSNTHTSATVPMLEDIAPKADIHQIPPLQKKKKRSSIWTILISDYKLQQQQQLRTKKHTQFARKFTENMWNICTAVEIVNWLRSQVLGVCFGKVHSSIFLLCWINYMYRSCALKRSILQILKWNNQRERKSKKERERETIYKNRAYPQYSFAPFSSHTISCTTLKSYFSDEFDKSNYSGVASTSHYQKCAAVPMEYNQ